MGSARVSRRLIFFGERRCRRVCVQSGSHCRCVQRTIWVGGEDCGRQDTVDDVRVRVPIPATIITGQLRNPFDLSVGDSCPLKGTREESDAFSIVGALELELAALLVVELPGRGRSVCSCTSRPRWLQALCGNCVDAADEGVHARSVLVVHLA